MLIAILAIIIEFLCLHQLEITVAIISLSLISNAFMDAICFGKGGEAVYELWHILKAISYFIPFAWMLFLIRATFEVCLFSFIGWWIGWITIYRMSRAFNIYKLDNKIYIPFICRIWGINRPRTIK